MAKGGATARNVHKVRKMGNITHIEKGNIEDKYLGSLAEIVYDAFETKITALGIQKEAAIEIIVNSMAPDSAFFAYQENRLVGAVGIVTNSSRFLNFRFKELRKRFNPLKAVVYYLILNFDSGIPKNELKIESLAVSGEMRGQGIGTQLVNRVEQFAAENGYSLLSLDVVDTNVAAQKLYERLGFEVVKTTKFGGLTRSAGFTSSYYMQKRIK